MIVVLSKDSVRKRWVREELNAGIVKRISGKCKVIPVIIDDCDVPTALQSTAWEKIENLDGYTASLDRIVASIYGSKMKPPLGPSPGYATLSIQRMAGLEAVDTLVFKTIVEASLKNESNFIQTQQISSPLQALDVSEDSMYESIDFLADRHYIRGKRTYGSKGLDSFFITPYGFERYALQFVPQFDERIDKVLLAIVNLEITNNRDIATHLDESRILIDYMLEILKRKGLIKISITMGNNISIHDVKTKGRRVARKL